jgi:hypothetical protein
MIPDDMERFRALMDRVGKQKQGPEMCTHPVEYTEAGYGLAGGGIGVYNYCGLCFKIISKVILED